MKEFLIDNIYFHESGHLFVIAEPPFINGVRFNMDMNENEVSGWFMQIENAYFDPEKIKTLMHRVNKNTLLVRCSEVNGDFLSRITWPYGFYSPEYRQRIITDLTTKLV